MNRFALFGFGLMCAAAPARDEVSREFSKTVPWRAGQSVTIAHKHGDVVVRGVTGSKEVSFRAFVRVSANTRAEAEQYSNGIQFDVTEGISFRTRYPELRSVTGFFDRLFKSQHLGYSVRLEVLAPEGAVLDVENAFGRVEVDSLRAGVTVRNDNGGIDVRKTAGLLRLTTKFSEARVSRNDGDVAVTNDNGAVSVADVKGSVTTRTRFGETEIERLTIFFSTFVMLQVWNLFNAKAFGTGRSAFFGLGKNPFFVGIMALIVVGQIAIVTFGGELQWLELLLLAALGAVGLGGSCILA